MLSALEHKSLHEGYSIIYIFGVLNQTSDIRTALVSIQSIMQPILQAFSQSKSLIYYILAPYIKKRLIELLKQNYVGSRVELGEIISHMKAINLRQDNSIKTLIRILIQEFEDELPESNSMWWSDPDIEA